MTNSDNKTKSSALSTQHSALLTQHSFLPTEAKIFVAGAAGMVGSSIIRRLIAMGCANIVGSYHSGKPTADKFTLSASTGEMPPGLRLAKVDLTHQSSVETFFKEEKPDYVFLAAAKVGGILANHNYPAQFIHDNLAIQNNVIHTSYQHNVKRLLFLGSSCIYPKAAPQPMKEAHLLTGVLEPTNEPYAIAKIAGIKMCESYNRQYGTRFVAVMPTNLYGPNDNFDLENSHVLPALIRKFHLAKLAANGDWEAIKKDESRFGPIPQDIKASLDPTTPSPLSPQNSALRTQNAQVTIWGTGSPQREFLYVDDMAAACLFVMQLDDGTLARELLSYPAPCFVNVGTGADCSIRALAETVGDVVGFEGKLVFDTSKPDGTPQKRLDVSRLATLGWQARTDLEMGIRKTYDWYLERLT